MRWPIVGAYRRLLLAAREVGYLHYLLMFYGRNLCRMHRMSMHSKMPTPTLNEIEQAIAAFACSRSYRIMSHYVRLTLSIIMKKV